MGLYSVAIFFGGQHYLLLCSTSVQDHRVVKYLIAYTCDRGKSFQIQQYAVAVLPLVRQNVLAFTTQ